MPALAERRLSVAISGAEVCSELATHKAGAPKTQAEIFQDERLSMDEEAAQEASEQGHPGIPAGVGKSNDFRLDGIFADYGYISFRRCGQVKAIRSTVAFSVQSRAARA